MQVPRKRRRHDESKDLYSFPCVVAHDVGSVIHVRAGKHGSVVELLRHLLHLIVRIFVGESLFLLRDGNHLVRGRFDLNAIRE